MNARRPQRSTQSGLAKGRATQSRIPLRYLRTMEKLPLGPSLHPRAARIERRGRGPVGEHAAHADLFCKHIEHRQGVAVAVDRGLDRAMVEAAALVERPVALQRPSD